MQVELTPKQMYLDLMSIGFTHTEAMEQIKGTPVVIITEPRQLHFEELAKLPVEKKTTKREYAQQCRKVITPKTNETLITPVNTTCYPFVVNTSDLILFNEYATKFIEETGFKGGVRALSYAIHEASYEEPNPICQMSKVKIEGCLYELSQRSLLKVPRKINNHIRTK